MERPKCKDKVPVHTSRLARKIVKLLNEKPSEKLFARHLGLIDELIDASPCGFWVRDLTMVMSFLYSIIDNIEARPVYLPYVERLLKLCRLPPMLMKSSEVLDRWEDLVEYFSMFGYLLVCVSHNELFSLICNAMSNILQKDTPRICCVSVEVCYRCISQSQLPKTITELMVVANYQFYIQLLEIVEYMTPSKLICTNLLGQRFFQVILHRLVVGEEEFDINYTFIEEHFDLTMRIMWTLLYYIDHSTDREIKLMNLHFDRKEWRSYQIVFRRLVISKIHRHRRNTFLNLLVLIDKLIIMDSLYISLLEDVVILASASENGTGGTWAAEVVFKSDKLDFEFKVSLILLLRDYAKYRLVFRDMMLSTFRIINPEIKLVWSDDQRVALITYTVIILTAMVEHSIEQFKDDDGPERLVKLLTRCIKNEISEAIMLPCLRCIYASIRAGVHIALEINYINEELFEILEDFVKNVLELPMLSLEDQKYLMLSFCILECLSLRLDSPKYSMMELSLHLLRRYLTPKEKDMILEQRLLVFLIDFMWTNLLCSEPTREYFINKGGVYVLLDVLSKASFPVQLISLSLIVDMCQLGDFINQLLTWRNDNLTVVELLLDLFRTDSRLRKAKSTQRGVIVDCEAAIVGEKQYIMTFMRKKHVDSSPAIMVMIGSVRPTIQALLHLLHCRRAIETNAINENYKISFPELGTTDKITMLVAENYLAFKMGEVWVELKRDLELAGIRPILFDQAVISAYTEQYFRWAKSVQIQQIELLRVESQNYILEEVQLYKKLKQSALESTLDALSELNYLARCTESIHRLMAKDRQTSEVVKSQAINKIVIQKYHTTFLRETYVTPVFNQKISVESNIVVKPLQIRWDDMSFHEENVENMTKPQLSRYLEYKTSLDDHLIAVDEDTTSVDY